MKIFISTDHIHRENIPDLDENIAFYQENCNHFYRFVDGANTDIMYEGNARENYSLDSEYVKDFRIGFHKMEYNNLRHVLHDGTMINVYGDVFSHPDLSYVRQDQRYYTAASIMKDDIIKELEQYNRKKEVLIFSPMYQTLDNNMKAVDY